MQCPLSDIHVFSIVATLPEQFDTLQFIARCPNGGDASGSACPVVQHAGSRGVCGRRLGEYQRRHGTYLRKDSTRSPARWTRLQGANRAANDDHALDEGEQPRGKRWDRFQRTYQVAFKEQVMGVQEHGMMGDSPSKLLYPRARWEENLEPNHRSEVVSHVRRHDIQLHEYVHHVLSSQAFAFNLMAPFLERPEALTPTLASLLSQTDAPPVQRVLRVELEYDGGKNYFGEPGRRGSNRTSADAAIWWQDTDGNTNLVLVEVKYTERSFGGCSKGHETVTCADQGKEIVRGGGTLCPLSHPPHDRAYWRLLRETNLLHEPLLTQTVACPFYEDGYQLMRTQLLAAVLERDETRILGRVDYAVLHHDDNPAILHPSGLPEAADQANLGRDWRRLLVHPERFHIWGAQAWIESSQDEAWRGYMMRRYFPSPGALGERVRRWKVSKINDPNGPARKGHYRNAMWLGSPTMQAYKSRCDRVCGEGMVLFRAVEDGIVQLVLSEDAPGFVGFRAFDHDSAHKLHASDDLLDEDALRERWQGFQRWVKGVRRTSREERMVIALLREALRQGLVIPGMPGRWRLLNHEWRFQDEAGRGKKSDIVVFDEAGSVGIVEFKDDCGKAAAAREQVRAYGRMYLRGEDVLQPLFMEQAVSMAKLYGGGEVPAFNSGQVRLFVGCPSMGASGVRFEAVTLT